MKKEVKFCFNCGEKTIQNYIGKESPTKRLGVARGIFAVFSFGITETLCAEKYYECLK